MKKQVLTAFLVILLVQSTIGITSVASAQTPKVSPTQELLVPAAVPKTGINLTLSPVFLNLVTDPGKEIASQFKVRNDNNVKEYLKVTIKKFQAANGGARPLLIDIGKDDTFAQWISFSDGQFTLDPNETKTIKFSINPPKDASLGYYYALVVQRVQEGNTEGKNATTVAGAPAVLVLLEVRSPNAKRELQLLNFTTNSFYEYLPAEFSIAVKNTGNIHIAPSGDIFIDRGNTKNVGIVRANESRGNILPQTKRTYTASWADGFAVRVPKTEDGKPVTDSKGNVMYTTKFDFTKANKIRIGKYTAHLLMVYDNGERDIPLEATVSFWVMPYRLILAGIGIILAPAFLVFIIMKLVYRKR